MSYIINPMSKLIIQMKHTTITIATDMTIAFITVFKPFVKITTHYHFHHSPY